MEVWNWAKIFLQNFRSIKTLEIVLSKEKDYLRRIVNQQVVAKDKTPGATSKIQSRLVGSRARAILIYGSGNIQMVIY